MKVEWRLFAGAAGFFAVTTTGYWFVSYEEAGSVMLALSVPAFLLVGAYLLVLSRRHGVRPEDRDDGSASDPDAAVELGYFPSSSIWPFYLACGAVVLANGFVFGPAVAGLGLLLLALATVGYAAEAQNKA